MFCFKSIFFQKSDVHAWKQNKKAKKTKTYKTNTCGDLKQNIYFTWSNGNKTDLILSLLRLGDCFLCQNEADFQLETQLCGDDASSSSYLSRSQNISS